MAGAGSGCGFPMEGDESVDLGRRFLSVPLVPPPIYNAAGRGRWGGTLGNFK